MLCVWGGQGGSDFPLNLTVSLGFPNTHLMGVYVAWQLNQFYSTSCYNKRVEHIHIYKYRKISGWGWKIVIITKIIQYPDSHCSRVNLATPCHAGANLICSPVACSPKNKINYKIYLSHMLEYPSDMPKTPSDMLKTPIGHA